MFHVLLVSLHDSGTFGHRCVSSALKCSGFRVSNVFFRANSVYQDAQPLSLVELRALADLAQRLSPDLVGINVHSSFGHHIARTVTSHLKQQVDAPIILGGVHPTLMPTFCLESTDADYVCIGEGEDAIVDICQRMQSGNNAHDTPGIMSKATGTYIPREPPQELDRLPFQDIGHDDKYSVYGDGSIREGDPLLCRGMYATKCSRGCPFRCSYCSVNQLRLLARRGRFYRLRSVERVIEEISQFLQMNPDCDHVRFWDDTFPFNSSWIQNFSALYERRIGLPFDAWLNPDTTKENNIAALRQAGLTAITMGIESASEKTRKAVFRRTETEDDILQADRILFSHRIARTYDFILDHPWESPTELEDMLELVKRLRKPFRLNMHGLALLPKTDLTSRAIKEGTVASHEQAVDRLSSDVQSSSRNIQWIRGVPTQRDLDRSRYIFLIMLAGHPDVPLWLTKFLASRKVLRQYPILLTDARATDSWLVHDAKSKVLRPLRALYGRYRPLRRFLNKRIALKRLLLYLVRRWTSVENLVYISATLYFRFLVQCPKALMTRGDSGISKRGGRHYRR